MANVADLLSEMAQKLQKCPRRTLAMAYVRATREFCGKSTWLRYVQAGTVVANTRLYSLGSDAQLEIIGIPNWQIADTTGTIGSGWLSAGTQFDPNDQKGAPIKLAYVPEGRFAVDPVPNATFNILLSLIVQPRLSASVLPDVLLSKWDRTLQAGALAWLYDLKSEPWYDPDQSAKELLKFQAGWTDAKLDVQRGYQYGPARMKPRPFVVG